MTDPLEAEIDRLYQLPPGELVDARNALADQLRKAGDKAAAARVKALKRPSPGAWALNQIHYHHAELLERAHAQTARLQRLHAQPGLDRQQLSAAVEAQRVALQVAVDAAMRCCDAAGVQAGPGQQRKVYASLQAWLAGTGDEAPGRMTHDIEPSGFEAMSAFGVTALPPLPVAASAEARPSAEAVPAVTRAEAQMAPTKPIGLQPASASAERAPAATKPHLVRAPERMAPDPRDSKHADELQPKREQRERESKHADELQPKREQRERELRRADELQPEREHRERESKRADELQPKREQRERESKRVDELQPKREQRERELRRAEELQAEREHRERELKRAEELEAERQRREREQRARELKRAEELLAEHEQRAREAKLRVHDRTSARDDAQRALDRAVTSVAEAEKTLAEARTRVTVRTAELARAEASAAQAVDAQTRADEASTRTRTELTRLKNTE